jgi:hypothetical protein
MQRRQEKRSEQPEQQLHNYAGTNEAVTSTNLAHDDHSKSRLRLILNKAEPLN